MTNYFKDGTKRELAHRIVRRPIPPSNQPMIGIVYKIFLQLYLTYYISNTLYICF